MPRKGENIYKRKDGRWEGRYIKSRSPTGKAIYGYVYAKSYRQVKGKLAKAAAQEKIPIYAEEKHEDVLFEAVAMEWFESTKPNIKESTSNKYWNLLSDLAHKTGCSIILSSHLINETENLATDYGILHNGKIISQFHSGQLSQAIQCIRIKKPTLQNTPEFDAFLKNWKKRIAICNRRNELVVYNTNVEDNALTNFSLAMLRSGIVSEYEIIQDNGTLDELFIALTGGGAENVVYS